MLPLPLPFATTAPPAGSRPDAVPIESLPQEILLLIADHILPLSDRLNFALTSRTLYAKVIPSVYSCVELDGVKQCKNTLTMLIKNPGVARHVRKLTVHPDRHPDTKAPLLPFSQEYCSLVSGLVADAARNMDALNTFVWNADGALPDDFMWGELRDWCPELKTIGTTFVQRLPKPSSELFTFNDLLGFSLMYKGTFYTPHNFWSRETEPIFRRLWDMLIHRCPNLRSLALEGDWDEPLYQPRLLEGNWLYLKALRLGPIRFDYNFLTLDSTAPLLGFLERHPSIEDLTLVGVRLDLTRLSPTALPKLRKFSGSLEDLRALTARRPPLPNANANDEAHEEKPSSLSETLTTLNILDPMMLRELTPLAVSALLSGLHALTSLTIVFSLQSGYDSNGVFRTIVSACPNLQHLDLTCTCKPSFHLDAFSRTLRSLTKLRTLSLTTVKVPGDEPMHAGATRIALSNPRLTHFTLAYIPPNRPLQRGSLPPQPCDQGRFALACDAHGIPERLLVWERYFRFGGMGARRTRRGVCELRPSGHPDAERKGWAATLVERGPAGEEARLLVFSVCLLALAAWGIVVGLVSRVDGASWRVLAGAREGGVSVS